MRQPLLEFELEDDNGVVYTLGPETRHALEISGLAMPPVRHWTTRSPFQHGRTHWGYAFGPRLVNLVLATVGCGRSGMYDGRKANVQMLNPMVSPLILRLRIPESNEVYELHQGWYTGGYELSSTDQGQYGDGTWNQVGGTQIEFEDPIWKWVNSPLDIGETRDADGRTCVETSTLVMAPQLVLPFTGPFLLGVTTGTATLTCTNDGSWATLPVISITGPTDDWILTNDTTGTQLSCNAYPISAGETVAVDVAARTVTNGAGTNLISYVAGDLATFALEPGANTITFFSTGGAINGTTTISVCWYVEFLGA